MRLGGCANISYEKNIRISEEYPRFWKLPWQNVENPSPVVQPTCSSPNHQPRPWPDLRPFESGLFQNPIAAIAAIEMGLSENRVYSQL
jgi:hypothetical protein